MFQLVLGKHNYTGSRVAQWKRAGPITQRSVDRNHALLVFFSGSILVSQKKLSYEAIILCLKKLPIIYSE